MDHPSEQIDLNDSDNIKKIRAGVDRLREIAAEFYLTDAEGLSTVKDKISYIVNTHTWELVIFPKVFTHEEVQRNLYPADSISIHSGTIVFDSNLPLGIKQIPFSALNPDTNGVQLFKFLYDHEFVNFNVFTG